MGLASGDRIGGYDILALIGTGGMGEVYRARDTRLKRDVAIKILPDAFTADAERVARFQREAELLATLNHPHIAQIYGLENAGETRALVLELVEGPTLADRIAHGPIPLDEALPIARQIAEALGAAHERGIVHRDLKPANIKITPDGTVKVLDLGLAKAADDGSGPLQTNSMSPTITSPAMTVGGVILGTAAYMSPEQARGKAVDKRADIWSFGCVFFEMLTGMRAFDGEEISDTLAAILRADPDWARLRRETPPPVRRLLQRCLEKEQKNRLQDIGDARLEILEALAPTRATEMPSVPTLSIARSVRVVVLSVLIGGALSGSGVWWLTRHMPKAEPAVRRYALTDPSVSPILVSTVDRSIAIAPDASTVAYVGGDGRLFLRRLDRLESSAVTPTVLANQPFFSPDSRSVAFVDVPSRQIKKMSLSGAAPITVAHIPNAARGATWTSDGQIVFATADTALGLQSVSNAGGRPVTLIAPDVKQAERFYWPESIPGTRTILFTVSRGSIESVRIAALNLDTMKVKTLTDGSHARYIPTGHLVFMIGSTMHAAPFNVRELELTGAPMPVLERVRTTINGAATLDIATDGSLIYVVGDVGEGQRTFAWVERSGKEEALPISPRAYAVPRLSPDGRRLVANVQDPANSDLFVFDLQRRSEMRLTFDRGQDVRPLWSPDGKWIFFRSDINGPGIYKKASDGSGTAQLVVPVSADGGANSVSADLKWLLYSDVGPTTGRDIWITTLNGTAKPQPLVVEPGQQGNPVLSPDLRWIAYHDETEGYIVVRPFPNVSGGRWQVSPPNSKWPLWSRDGRELFFVSGPANSRGIMSVAVQAQRGTFEWSAPGMVVSKAYAQFFNNVGPRNYDLSSDGTRFLVIRESDDGGANRAIVMVENWFEELRQRVAAK